MVDVETERTLFRDSLHPIKDSALAIGRTLVSSVAEWEANIEALLSGTGGFGDPALEANLRGEQPHYYPEHTNPDQI